MKIKYIESSIEDWKEEFTFFHKTKVRFSETDMFGHMNNTVPFTYFEEARFEFFKHLGYNQDFQQSEVIPVVADLQCDFLRQVYFGEELTIGVNIDKFGTSSMDIHYLAENISGQLCFVGRGSMVQISKRTGKSAPWNEEDKKKMLEVMNSKESNHI
ncbi:thioesterase family protein [Bacillus carboniphilus]|uniref:Thioesterase family protein n=1 Tax=Bacillus carboniphilus TaxID=86663 RepID=A0ABY9JZB8_9BACI|nr:thioesterase family protein [Bacillus carboniphilus]WLR44123.1 thioesterase family protein [Bacillus carboniphilus]